MVALKLIKHIFICLVLIASANIIFGQVQPKNEFVADQNGICHFIISGEENSKAFLQIPSGVNIVFHDLLKIREELNQSRLTGNFEVLDATVPIEELMKDRPALDITRVIESYNGIHKSNCENGETVSCWWNRGNLGTPNAYDGIEDHVNMIFQKDAHPWWNYIVFGVFGSNCSMEVYLTYNRNQDTPTFNVYDWNCAATGPCAGHAGTGDCSARVDKATLLSGYVAYRYDGQHWLPIIYPVTNEFYVPNENSTFPYKNEVWLYRFSPSPPTWVRIFLRYHATRDLIGSSGNQRAMWIEYHYTWNGGPGCSGETHPDFGFIGYWHCRSSDGQNNNCNWYRPLSGDSFISNDHSNPITIQHVVQNYTFHVTKP